MAKKEAGLHLAVAHYLAMQYPTLIFNTDLSGIRLTMGQAIQVKRLRSSNSFPDIVIYEPKGPYYGLFIELKHREAKLIRKDGYLVGDQRIRDQNSMLHKLCDLGYMARFGHGFDKTLGLIEWYMSLENQNVEMQTECPIPIYYEKDKTEHPNLPF